MSDRYFALVISVLALTHVSNVVFASSRLTAAEQNALRQKYASLYDEAPHQLADGSWAFEQSRLFQKNGFNVLYLRGDSFEMAFQHALLMKDQIKDGALELTSDTIANTVANVFPNSPFLARAVTHLIDKFITGRIFNYALRQLPDEMESYKETAFAMSEGSGISPDVFVRAALSPETLMVLGKAHPKEWRVSLDGDRDFKRLLGVRGVGAVHKRRRACHWAKSGLSPERPVRKRAHSHLL